MLYDVIISDVYIYHGSLISHPGFHIATNNTRFSLVINNSSLNAAFLTHQNRVFIRSFTATTVYIPSSEVFAAPLPCGMLVSTLRQRNVVC